MSRGSEGAGRPTDRLYEQGVDHLDHSRSSAPDATDCLRLGSPNQTLSGRPVGSLRFVREQLSERDRAVLHSLASLRLMTTRQLERLHFREGSSLTQARRCRFALERLHQLGLVHRLGRRTVGGLHAGSASYIYTLASRGRRLLDLSGPAGGRRRRPAEPSIAFQDHVLAIAELCVRLHEEARRGTYELARFVAEPSCWRTYAGIGGDRQVLKPDAFVQITDAEFETLSFVEVDRGTEGRTAIRRKGEVYLAYALTGSEQAHSGVFPRVVFLVPDEPRADMVRRALTPVRRSDELFVVGLERDASALLSGGLV
jgi:hypothetical protein